MGPIRPVLLLALVCAAASRGCCSATPSPRAIILMLGDDYGFGNVGFAHGPSPGNPESRTPHMDSLAREGVILDRHYVYKYCSPTRCSLMSGRLPPHVNQNNRNNHIEATSGVDLRFTMLSQKMKLAGYSTHFVGKSHLGARSPANLPINRGFDTHFGFLKGGEDHYTQRSGSSLFQGPTVDLWENHGPSNRSGVYSGYNYAQRAVEIISKTMPREQLFMYIGWHNTHTPLECPEEWMYPPLGLHGGVDYSNFSQRMTYNCMSRILDDGIGNVTTALVAKKLWNETLMLFSADNGGWAGNSGSNNFPLRGSKVSDYEGGVRAVAFLAGGYLPADVRGTVHTGLIAVADWYGTLCKLVGVKPTDDVPGLPPVDSIDVWPSLIQPNANFSGRDEIFLSFSCSLGHPEWPVANASGCDLEATSIYGTSGEPTHGQAAGDSALISGRFKIIFGQQQGRGVWFGPVYPNGTADGLAFPCVDGCLFDIFQDPTEHINLKDVMPTLFEQMRSKLLAYGKTLYQTDYAEPGTTGPNSCLTAAEAHALYVGHDTCIHGIPGVYNPSLPSCDPTIPQFYQGPMCFKDGEKPYIPPIPPPPPAPTQSSMAICRDSGCQLCLTTLGGTHDALKLSRCNLPADKNWGYEHASDHPQWLLWLPTSAFIKLDERQGGSSHNVTLACAVGDVYVNPSNRGSGKTVQGFYTINASTSTITTRAVQLASSACPNQCLTDGVGGLKLAPCSELNPWILSY